MNLARLGLIATLLVLNACQQADLDRLADAGIPADIVFEKGAQVLGL